jgi:hypothetical protein
MYYTNTHSVCSRGIHTYTCDICEYVLLSFIIVMNSMGHSPSWEATHSSVFMRLVFEVTMDKILFLVLLIYIIIQPPVALIFHSLPSINANTTFILNVTSLHLKFIKCRSLLHVSASQGHHQASINWRKSPHCTDSHVNITMLLLHVVVYEKCTLALPSRYFFIRRSRCVPFGWFS